MELDGRYIWRLSSNSRAAMRRLRVGVRVGVGRVEHRDEGGAAQYEASKGPDGHGGSSKNDLMVDGDIC